MATPLFFSTFEVTRQALPPSPTQTSIFPGHVLVCPMRPTLRLTDLRADELAELVCAVQRVGRVVERAYKADGLTIAYQDSVAAGQAVISSRGVYRAIASPGLEMTRFSINLRSRRGRSRSA